jgi:hypothetical protein
MPVCEPEFDAEIRDIKETEIEVPHRIEGLITAASKSAKYGDLHEECGLVSGADVISLHLSSSCLWL